MKQANTVDSGYVWRTANRALGMGTRFHHDERRTRLRFQFRHLFEHLKF